MKLYNKVLHICFERFILLFRNLGFLPLKILNLQNYPELKRTLSKIISMILAMYVRY